MTLFVGGPDGQFTTESSVASANEPANKMHFVRDHPLKKGNNWFWLSGKISPEAIPALTGSLAIIDRTVALPSPPVFAALAAPLDGAFAPRAHQKHADES